MFFQKTKKKHLSFPDEVKRFYFIFFFNEKRGFMHVQIESTMSCLWQREFVTSKKKKNKKKKKQFGDT